MAIGLDAKCVKNRTADGPGPAHEGGLLTVDLVVLVLPVFDGSNIKGCPVGENHSIWLLSWGEIKSIRLSHPMG